MWRTPQLIDRASWIRQKDKGQLSLQNGQRDWKEREGAGWEPEALTVGEQEKHLSFQNQGQKQPTESGNTFYAHKSLLPFMTNTSLYTLSLKQQHEKLKAKNDEYTRKIGKYQWRPALGRVWRAGHCNTLLGGGRIGGRPALLPGSLTQPNSDSTAGRLCYVKKFTETL